MERTAIDEPLDPEQSHIGLKEIHGTAQEHRQVYVLLDDRGEEIATAMVGPLADTLGTQH